MVRITMEDGGIIDIEPLGHVPSFHDVYETINHDKAVDAFAKTAFLKLNG